MKPQSLMPCAALLLLLCQPAGAQPTRQYTEIAGTGQTLFRIAIPPVLDGGAAANEAKILQSVMVRDMTLIGLFKVLEEKAYLANLAREGAGIEIEPWVTVGAQGVVKARAAMLGRELNVTFYLYDVGKGTSPVLSKVYKGTSGQVRHLAHQFGDDIVHYYTGEKGIFTTKIAFASASPKDRTSYIYIMDYDGNGVYRLSNTGSQNVLPAWSPGGQIAFTSFLWRNTDLFVSSGGGRARRISRWPGLNTGAAWHPGGGSIALTLSKDGNAELYLISSTTGEVKRRLTNHEAIDTSPTWSPDGSQLAFVSNRGGSPQIYVLSASGGEPRRLTFQGSYNQEPDWCPRKENPVVAFTGRDEGGNYDIFTIHTQTGQIKRLTQGQGSNKSPTWAPNGRILGFTSSRGGIWISNEDGLNQHQVYRGGAQTPDWSK